MSTLKEEMGLENLITNEEREALHDLAHLIPIVKSKYFSLGRDLDKFMKLCEKIGGTDGNTDKKTASVYTQKP